MLKKRLLIALMFAAPTILGCEKTPPASPPVCTITTPPPGMSEGHSDHDHTHPGHGPHEGELIELGNEEYHAELIHDDKSVTIYILDGAATKAVPIEAKELVVNLKHEGKPEQFKLVATPDAGDESGKSSKFSSADPELAGHLDEKEADAKLVVEINGKSFRGSLAHDHDHGHEHK